MAGNRCWTNQPFSLFIKGYIFYKNTPIYIEHIHSARGKIYQLLGFRSDDHALHTKLLRFDAPFVVPPRAATGSLRNHRRRVLRSNSTKTAIHSAGWFWGSTTKSSWVSHRVRIPHVMDWDAGGLAPWWWAIDNTVCVWRVSWQAVVAGDRWRQGTCGDEW
jgi:hypothetical protein